MKIFYYAIAKIALAFLMIWCLLILPIKHYQNHYDCENYGFKKSEITLNGHVVCIKVEQANLEDLKANAVNPVTKP